MALQGLGIVTDGETTMVSKTIQRKERALKGAADMWDDKKGKQRTLFSLPPDKGNREKYGGDQVLSVR